jgi:hypothetical protein
MAFPQQPYPTKAACAGFGFFCAFVYYGPWTYFGMFAAASGVQNAGALCMFFAGVGSLFGRVLWGIAADRMGASVVLCGNSAGFLLLLLFWPLMASDSTRIGVAAFGLLFGSFQGGGITSASTCVAQLFREFPETYATRTLGLVFGPASLPGSFGGTVVFGEILQKSGQYSAIAFLAACQAAACCIALWLHAHFFGSKTLPAAFEDRPAGDSDGTEAEALFVSAVLPPAREEQPACDSDESVPAAVEIWDTEWADGAVAAREEPPACDSNESVPAEIWDTAWAGSAAAAGCEEQPACDESVPAAAEIWDPEWADSAAGDEQSACDSGDSLPVAAVEIWADSAAAAAVGSEIDLQRRRELGDLEMCAACGGKASLGGNGADGQPQVGASGLISPVKSSHHHEHHEHHEHHNANKNPPRKSTTKHQPLRTDREPPGPLPHKERNWVDPVL